MSRIRKVVGENIRFFRNTRGLSQEELAEKVCVSGSYVGYLERGQKSPSLELLERIARVLQVDPAELLASSDDKEPELKRLIAFLSNKGPAPLKFMNEVADAYFRSLEREQ